MKLKRDKIITIVRCWAAGLRDLFKASAASPGIASLLPKEKDPDAQDVDRKAGRTAAFSAHYGSTVVEVIDFVLYHPNGPSDKLAAEIDCTRAELLKSTGIPGDKLSEVVGLQQRHAWSRGLVSGRKPFLTVTGADERTDLARLRALDVEVGILFSLDLSAAATIHHRYPRWGWIREASMELPRCALHVCGGEARRELELGKLPVAGFQRIQVNGFPSVKLVERICALYPRHRIITQQHPRNEHLLNVDAPNHEVLLDQSGGRGKLPSSWDPPYTQKAVGFAGGLGPDNLRVELRRILPNADVGWWVDAESRLRDEDDWFSVDRVEEMAHQFKQPVNP